MIDEVVQCVECGEEYSLERRRLGFLTCARCGEEEAREVRHLIIPVHKSNDMVITMASRDMLKGAGCKGGQVLGGGSGETSSGTNREAPQGAGTKLQCGSTKAKAEDPQDVREDESDTARAQSRRTIIRSVGGGELPRRDPWFRRSGYKR